MHSSRTIPNVRLRAILGGHPHAASVQCGSL